MKKRILILGAGEAQLNLIKCALKLGYYTIVCDMRSNTEAERISDKYYQENYIDLHAILKIAKQEDIDGVISNSEAAMSSVSYLVDVLGLPGNGVESVEKLLSKEKFRELQYACGSYAPKHYIVDNISDLGEKAKLLTYPILIKPVESSGTRGVTKMSCFDSEKLHDAYTVCKRFSRNGLVTLEEYVEMSSLRVFQADIFVADGNILWDGLFTTKRAARMPFVPMTHVFPVISTATDINRLKENVERVVLSSGISLGELNVEAYITPQNDIFVIEINARQGGNHIPELIEMHTGVDLTKLLVSMTVNDRSYFEELKHIERKNDNIMLHMVFPKQAGKYKGLCIAPEIKPYIFKVKETIESGEFAQKEDNAEDVVAYIFMKFDSREKQIYYSERMEEYITAKIEL